MEARSTIDVYRHDAYEAIAFIEMRWYILHDRAGY